MEANNQASRDDVFIEYLENMKLFNLILTLDVAHSLNEVKYTENYLKLTFKDKNDNESNQIIFNFDDFEIEKNTFFSSKINFNTNLGYLENIFKFRIKNSIEFISATKQSSSIQVKKTELSKLLCSMCKQNFLKPNDKSYAILPLPDNEANELADNFFCHLHSHGDDHDHSESRNLIDSLNTMSLNTKMLRKSILEGLTVYVLNENHLNMDLIKLNNENLYLECDKCSFRIGYKDKKNKTDFFLWKSNLIHDQKEDPRNSMIQLFEVLTTGRYLLETKTKPISYIYLCILNENFIFNSFKCEQLNRISLEHLNNLKKSKKLIYKFANNRNECLNQNEQTSFIKTLHNDCNVDLITISEENYDFVLNYLRVSTEKFCFSLKSAPNDFYLALI